MPATNGQGRMSEGLHMESVVSFPWTGEQYTRLIRSFLESLGVNVRLPPPITDRTIKLGTRHSPDMICFPYKVTLGSMIEALEQGTDILLMHDNYGQCRQRHYWKIQEMTLRDLGYRFQMWPISRRTFFPSLRRLTGKSHMAIWRAYREYVASVEAIDARQTRWAEDRLNIAFLGEIYTCFEETINNNLAGKLRELGVNPYAGITLTEIAHTTYAFGWRSIPRSILKLARPGGFDPLSPGAGSARFAREAQSYLNGPIGGHAYENICQLLWLRDRGVDGVIHLLPLSCMPETMIEPIINRICQQGGIPMLRLPIDETNSQANFETRIETFVELIKRKGKRNEMVARH